MKPTVGRIVHYVSYGTPGGEFASECRAAIVTQVVSERLASLCVMNPTGLFLNQRLPYDENKSPGTWHWPEWVERD